MTTAGDVKTVNFTHQNVGGAAKLPQAAMTDKGAKTLQMNKDISLLRQTRTVAEHGFPVIYSAQDNFQDRVTAKVQAAEVYDRAVRAANNRNVRVQVSSTDKDVDAFIKAEKVQLQYNFDRQFGFIVERAASNPAWLDILVQRYPEWFDNQLKLIKAVASLQERLARIKIFGAYRNDEDFNLWMQLKVMDGVTRARLFQFLDTPVWRMNEVRDSQERTPFSIQQLFTGIQGRNINEAVPSAGIVDPNLGLGMQGSGAGDVFSDQRPFGTISGLGVPSDALV